MAESNPPILGAVSLASNLDDFILFVLEGVEAAWTPGRWREELLTRFDITQASAGIWIKGSDYDEG